MTWTKEDWGSFLMGAGVIMILISVPLARQTFSIVGVDIGGVIKAQADLPPVSAGSLIAGIVLLAFGAYLKGFFKR